MPVRTGCIGGIRVLRALEEGGQVGEAGEGVIVSSECYFWVW